MAKKVNNTNKINKESKSTETARDKGVNSTDLLCKNKSENIEDDLIIGTYVKHNNKIWCICTSQQRRPKLEKVF
jgi:hypothetical protein